MQFELVDSNWDDLFERAVRAEPSAIRIVCPFIKLGAIKRLLAPRLNSLHVITRYSLDDFANGVSDLSALRLLLRRRAQVRGIKNLHSKLYLFDGHQAIITSANLTVSALRRNHEFGFTTQEPALVRKCLKYFDALWEQAPPNLDLAHLSQWENRIASEIERRARFIAGNRLGDEGAEAITDVQNLTPGVASQAFVKIFGDSHDRESGSRSIREQVEESGCHWACTYPRGKRPRSVRNGATMFMGQLTHDPYDILIYGKAFALRRHQPRRDDASPADISNRQWKQRWPHYIRVRDPRFINASLADGVSLTEMKNALGANSFRSTQENAAWNSANPRSRRKNIDPTRAYRQQPAVQLSPQGTAWINERLERAFRRFGELTASNLTDLDWPNVPST